MSLDGKFYKKEIREKVDEANYRRIEIERYLSSKFNLDYHYFKAVADALEKSSLDVSMLRDGTFDNGMADIIADVKKKKQSEIDAVHIKNQEKNEHTVQAKSVQSESTQVESSKSESSQEELEFEKLRKEFLEKLQKQKQEMEERRREERARFNRR